MAASSGKLYLDLKIEPLPKKVSRLQLETFIHAVHLKITTDTRFKVIFPDVGELTWKGPTIDNRGFSDTLNGLTGAQKKDKLELMLKTIHVLCQHISRSFIVNEAKSFSGIWNRLRIYYGYRKTGARPLDLPRAHLKSDQSVEDLWEEILALGEDCLRDPSTAIQHLDTPCTVAEQLQPAYLNVLVVWWLNAVDHRLPMLVGERFAKELTNNDLYSIREEVSEAIPSLLAQTELSTTIRRLRTGTRPQNSRQVCSICTKAGLPHDHYTSKCQYLSPTDRQFFARSRLVHETDTADHDQEPTTRRVEMESSPVLSASYGQSPVSIVLDSGAESNLMSSTEAARLGILCKPASQGALQADGATRLHVVGECHVQFSLKHHMLVFNGLVIHNLGTPIVGGVPFIAKNAIIADLSSKTIIVSKCCQQTYELPPTKHAARQVSAIIRFSKRITIVPDGSIDIAVPPSFSTKEIVAIEPRQTKTFSTYGEWLQPDVQEVSSTGTVRIRNSLNIPIRINANEQLGNIRRTRTPSPPRTTAGDYTPLMRRLPTSNGKFSNSVNVDPNKQLTPSQRQAFININIKHDEAFSPELGCYNGSSGKLEMKINMGPTKPPPRKGRCPVYAHSDKALLQSKFDQLKEQGVFARPEELGIQVECVSPSFLIRKDDRGDAKQEDLGLLDRSRLVTAFGEVAQFAKVQPCLMSNINEALDQIGQWTYMIQSDFSQAYYQCPVARDSLKWLGVCTPFKGTYVYQRAAMGMPGSEACLEELLCQVLGDFMAQGKVVKLADDIFCGAETPEELLEIWDELLGAIQANGLHLSAKKTSICPVSTTVLGWVWHNATLYASPHKLSALETCDPPSTVKGMRGFIAAYKFLSRVLPGTRRFLGALEEACSSKKSKDPIEWTEALGETYRNAQRHLSNAKSIVVPRPNDELHIITDAAMNQRGLAATLFAIRNGTPKLAGFFNAKMRPHQQRWLPCEVEALCISAAVKFFAPKIARSLHHCTVFTDSKPCVQAYAKLCRGCFSNSARVMVFLSSLCTYGLRVQHISGQQNLVADFTSRNPVECPDPTKCHVCKFVAASEEAMIGALSVAEIPQISLNMFASRPAWRDIQMSDPDLRRVHALLSQGTTLSKKTKHAKDVKRYLNEVVISNDGLLIRRPVQQRLVATRDRIVIPRAITHGLVTAVHLRLNHPSKRQLSENLSRCFYALNLHESIETVHSSCDVCSSIKTVPSTFVEQSTSRPSGTIGTEYSADIVRRYKQFILVLRENTSSYTCTTFIENETADSIREGLIYVTAALRNHTGPKVTIRVDPASAFRNLATDTRLRNLGISLVIGDEKNPNKNPIAERAVRELHLEIVKLDTSRGPISRSALALATSNINNLIRNNHLSAREIWTQRDQLSGHQIPLQDKLLIDAKFHERNQAHMPSAKYKSRGKESPTYPPINVGNLVYIISERNKTQRRDKYLVTKIEHPFCWVRKFVGDQLRARPYRVNMANILPIKLSLVDDDYGIPHSEFNDSDNQPNHENDDDNIHAVGDNLPVGHDNDVNNVAFGENHIHDDHIPVRDDDPVIEPEPELEQVAQREPDRYIGGRQLRRGNFLRPPKALGDYELDSLSEESEE